MRRRRRSAPAEGPGSGAPTARGRGGGLAIKLALMDQQRIAGLGNIHTAEALFRARLHPDRPVGSLSRPELARLARGIAASLRHAMQHADPEGFDYVSEGGDNPFRVYGREDQPCPRCRAPIRRTVHAGRSTFFCARCQR